MAIFSKLDKKTLFILVIILIVILLVSFMVYKYVAGFKTGAQNLSSGTQIQKGSDKISSGSAGSIANNQQVQIEVGGVQAEGNTGLGALSVCLDKCGDGICQKTDPNCSKNNNLNCICPETPQECPQDCK